MPAVLALVPALGQRKFKTVLAGQAVGRTLRGMRVMSADSHGEVRI
jgi:hypothetical protein